MSESNSGAKQWKRTNGRKKICNGNSFTFFRPQGSFSLVLLVIKKIIFFLSFRYFCGHYCHYHCCCRTAATGLRFTSGQSQEGKQQKTKQNKTTENVPYSPHLASFPCLHPQTQKRGLIFSQFSYITPFQDSGCSAFMLKKKGKQSKTGNLPLFWSFFKFWFTSPIYLLLFVFQSN